MDGEKSSAEIMGRHLMESNALVFLSGLKLEDDLLIAFLIVIIILLLGILLIVVKSILFTHTIEGVLSRKIKSGEFNEVIRIAKEYVDHNADRNKRNNLYVIYYLAQAYEALESQTSAVKFFTEANMLAYSSKNRTLRHSILLHIGRLYEKMGKTKDALAHFLLLINEDEKNSEALYEIAQIQYRGKNIKKARESLEKLLKLRPGLLDARFLYGKILYESGAFTAAMKQFTLLERHDPENAEVFHYKAKTLENLKKYSEAIREYRKLLAKEGSNPKQLKVIEESQIAIIHLYIKIKDYMSGIQNVSEFLTKPASEKSKVELIYLYANLLWNTGDEYSALKNFERVHTMNRNFKDSGIMVERYKKILPHSYLIHYFTSNEDSFEAVCRKILARHNFNLQFKQNDFFIFTKGVFYVVFYRHIEPLPFSKLTDMEIIMNSFDVKPQNTEIYTLSGIREDAVTHFLLKSAKLIEGDEFIRTIKKLYYKEAHTSLGK